MSRSYHVTERKARKAFLDGDATNVTGPYAPVSGATSPWTNSFSKAREFFKLQGF